MSEARRLLETLCAGEDLGEARAAALLDVLVDPAVSDTVKGGLLAALRTKGETPEEVRGLATAMRQMAVAVPLDEGSGAVDTCGTGGDGSDSFNVSTATALLAAACGVPVVKHGNRSVSSRSGSADLLAALGLRMDEDPATVSASLVDTRFAFLFAPAFHPATAAVVPVRRALGVRTVFNLLGPLTNPARPPYQLLGAWSADAARLMAHALAGMGVTRAFVVHGEPGWDEATPCGPFLRLDVRDGAVVEEVLDPRDDGWGLPRHAPDALAGGSPEDNAQMLRNLFGGARGAVRDAVVLNTALVLELTGEETDRRAARQRVEDVLDRGGASWFLERLVARHAVRTP